MFFAAFIQANLSVAYTILFVKNKQIRPHLVEYYVQDLSHFEILMMAQLITLTPGTIATNIDEKNKIIFVHILNAPDPDEVIEKIDSTLKKALLEVAR